MFDNPKLLVVDDEASICRLCARIFSQQGYQVEECTNACQGLNQASKGDYAGIMLDIKMPEMSGVEFLEQLRKTKPEIPVMIMTGYPSIPSAALAVQLGASDYITKPFTPEQITQSVRRMLSSDRGGATERKDSPKTIESSPELAGEFLFLNESWVQLKETACVGAVLKRSQQRTARSVQLPQVGEAVYQGLPLAGVHFSDESLAIVPSPISGVVVAVNKLLVEDPSALLDAPCGKGWIARICATRIESEIDRCGPRNVILANTDSASVANQFEKLSLLGCRGHIVKNREELTLIVQDRKYNLLLFDAASFGEIGPELVRQVNIVAPALKVVVIGPSVPRWEAAYREQRIFYYAVEPFFDNELLEILDTVFRLPLVTPCRRDRRKVLSDPVSRIGVTDHSGHRVLLLAAPRLLRESDGLGGQIRQNLIDRLLPIKMALGERPPTPTEVLRAAGACDRVIVLIAKDTGRLPGSLVKDTSAEYVSANGVSASKVATLAVQPVPDDRDLTRLDERIIGFLAEHVVREMVVT